MRIGNPLVSITIAVAASLASSAVLSALPVGASAPDFTTEAALGGTVTRFSLADALKKGPVVLYFYPKAFTEGCTVEAHEFAEATPRFNALGATVIGMSNDDIGTLKKFSVEACRNKFAVGADAGGRIMGEYDAKLTQAPGYADRISYVISPEGKVIYVYASLDPDRHVENTMKAIEQWKASAKP
jgi:thioredoxin-dependent peroxiredoxin